jgi:uncharacterized repeat protein (TIGR01451 family)
MLAVCAATIAALAASARAQQVRISQVWGGGSGSGAPYRFDFVELFNAGASPVDVTGWSIQYADYVGGFSGWATRTLPPALIPPGGYYLIQMSTTGSSGQPLPTPDLVVEPGINMHTGGGRVALARTATALSGPCPLDEPTLIDLVGYGDSNTCFEGSGPVPVLTEVLAARRLGGGCADTNDNAADFARLFPMPRNSTGWEPAPCPLPPGADVGLTLDADATRVDVGSPVSFTARVTNYGPEAAADITLRVPIPPNATFVSSDPPGEPADGELTLGIPVMAPGAVWQVSLTLNADAGLTISPAATVSTSGADADPSNNSDQASVPIYDRSRAVLVIGANSSGLPVSAIDVGSGLSEPLFTAAVRGLASDDANRVFYYSSGAGGRELWKAPYDPPRTPVFVGTIRYVGTVNAEGLAFDSGNGILYAVSGSLIYEINPHTARATLLRTTPYGAITGIDYDPILSQLIGTVGGAFYRFDPNGGDAARIVQLPAVPPGGAAHGCAAGGGYLYAVSDSQQWVRRYNVASGAFESPLTTGFGDARGAAGATYTAELFTPSPGANIAVDAIVPPNCTVAAGEDLTYVVRVRNFGPEDATGVVLTSQIPTTTIFHTSTPAFTPADAVIVYPVGTLAAGATADLAVTVMTRASGPLDIHASAASGTPDPFPASNSTTSQFRVATAPSGAPPPEIVFSTMPGSNNVPGLDGRHFVYVGSAPTGRIFGSSNGSHWIMSAQIDSTATSRVLLRGQGTAFEVAAQVGVTQVEPPSVIGTLDALMGINSDADFAIGTFLNARESVVKGVGGEFVVVAQRDRPIPAIPGANFGAFNGSVTIGDAGGASFLASIAGAPAATDTVLLSADGSVLIAQKGVTVPLGQAGGATDPIRTFDSGSTPLLGCFVSGDSLHHAYLATVGPDDADDTVVVVDGAVAIQQGYPLAASGFSSPVSTIQMVYMDPHANWYSYGVNADGQDWAVKNGMVLARSGDEIYPGAGVTWDDGIYDTFSAVAGNSRGDTVVGGQTSAQDADANAFLVLNSQRVVLRENDPVDIDRNGVFDDDAFVDGFRRESIVLTDDRVLYVAVWLRNGESVCDATGITFGEALLSIDLGAGECPVDWNADMAVNSQDFFAFLADFFNASADFNADGTTTSQDFFDFLAAFFVGC